MDALLICFHQCNVLLFSSRIPSLGMLDSSVCTLSFRTWCFLGINNSLPWSPLSSPKWDEPLGSINRNNLELYTLWTEILSTKWVLALVTLSAPDITVYPRQRPRVWGHWPHVSACARVSESWGRRESTNNEWPSLAPEADIRRR